MKEKFYTHALWQVKEGKTEEFVAAWKNFGEALSKVPNSPPIEGTLIQSLSDPLVFYSFGSWETLEDINFMRSNENVKQALSGIIELCTEATPGNYKTVEKLSFPGTRKESLRNINR
jgi:heme-degrading monooxygenase HmoA